MACLFFTTLLVHAFAPAYATARPLLGSEEDATELVQLREKYDPYKLYDQKPLLTLTTCREKEDDASKAEETVDKLLDFGCWFIREEGRVRQPPPGGCASEPVVCSKNVTEIMKVANLKLDHHNAGETLRAKNGGLPKKWIADYRAGPEFQARGQVDRLNESFYERWRPMDDMLGRIRDLVEGYRQNLENTRQSISIEELTPTTREGRRILAVTLRGSGCERDRNDAWECKGGRIVLVAQVHAREWIAGMSTIYVMEDLLRKASHDGTWLDDLEVAIVPIGNPDGFEYSQRFDRFWRKNSAGSSWEKCEGTDINRNWPLWWGQGGSSSRKCSQVYMGSRAMSEPEVAALNTFSNRSQATVVIDIHSYGPMVLKPWSGRDMPIPWKDQFDRLGSRILEALNRNNPVPYSYLGVLDGLYLATGSYTDYMTNCGALALVIELRPHRPENQLYGMEGFDPPESLIQPVATELSHAMSQVVKYVHRHPRSPH